MREGNIFSLFTLVEGRYPVPGPDRGEGVPHPAHGWRYPIPGPDGGGGTQSQVQMGGTPSYWGGTHSSSGWGVPHPRSKWGGVTHPTDEGTPIQDQDRGYPGVTGWGTPLYKIEWGTLRPRLDGVPPCSRLDGVPPPPSGDWSAKRALATRRALCLLYSSRRTFLFVKCLNLCRNTWFFAHFKMMFQN